MEIPEDSKIIVFMRGTLIGSNGSIVFGGHMNPSSTVGAILLWKKAQKNEIKKNTSDVMNKAIPIFNPSVIFSMCSPIREASRKISFHQLIEEIISSISDRNIISVYFVYIEMIIENINTKEPIDDTIGQGLFSTK